MALAFDFLEKADSSAIYVASGFLQDFSNECVFWSLTFLDCAADVQIFAIRTKRRLFFRLAHEEAAHSVYAPDSEPGGFIDSTLAFLLWTLLWFCHCDLHGCLVSL